MVKKMIKLDIKQNNRLVCLAMVAGFTWLNPHVWIDMVMIVGSTAQSIPLSYRISFILGIALTSTIWFLLLGYSSRLLRPIFENQLSWRILDFLTAMMMFGIAIHLMMGL